MRRPSTALLAALVLAVPGAGRPADPAPPAGNWKVLLPMRPGDATQPLWIVKFEKKGDEWVGSVVAAGERVPKAALENLRVDKEALRFDLKLPTQVFRFEGKLPGGKDKGGRIYASMMAGRDVAPAELERTTLTRLDRFSLDKEALARGATGAEAIRVATSLLRQAGSQKAGQAEVRSWADRAVRAAGLYGPRFQREIMLEVAATLLSEQEGYEKVALQYAQRAERALEPKEPPAAQKKVLDVYALALEKAGKADQAKEVLARVKKLDFRIKPKADAGRKGKGDRVVLVELFTGAHAEECVAADLAFDALGRTFKPTEVVLLQYHLHAPKPDPLTAPDGEARARSYGEHIRGLPTSFFNGRSAAGGGGERSDAQDKYEEYLAAVEPLLESPAKARVKVRAVRKGEKVDITAEVDKLEKTGGEVRLRLALVEEQVKYKGANGLTTHTHVVRAFPGGADGTPMKEKSAKKTVSVDLDKLRKDLKAYLDKYAEKRPFPDKERPLELKKLRVVAFIQDDETEEVLQAAQAEVAEK
jgi:hypothetical protein